MGEPIVILYDSPGACSLAAHIALHEADTPFDRIEVDLKTHMTKDGRDYSRINPKGYVPALALDGGYLLTENVAILGWIADQAPAPTPGGDLGRYRLLEALAFISTEIHKAFKPMFKPGASDAEKAKAGETIAGRLGFVAGQFAGDYIFGDEVSVADAYLFVMLGWAMKFHVAVPEPLIAYADRMKARPAVALALRHEGLD